MKNGEWLKQMSKREFGMWLCDFRGHRCNGCPMEDNCYAADYYIDGMTNWLDMEKIN